MYNLITTNNIPTGYVYDDNGTYTEKEAIYCQACNKVDATKSEYDAKIAELQAEYDAQEYARNRSTEYPALAEQLDEIYHNGIDSWKAVIKVTKDKYPKG